MPPPPRTTLPPQHISNVSVIKAGRQNAMAPPTPPPLNPHAMSLWENKHGCCFPAPPPPPHHRHPPPVCSGCNTCSNDPSDRIRQLPDISIQGPEARSKNSDAAPFPLPPHTHARTEPVSRQTKHRLNPLATHQSLPESPQTSRHNLVLHQHKLEVSSGAQVSWPQGWVGGAC